MSTAWLDFAADPEASRPSRDRPVADYAFLSDCQSAALVNSAGCVEWLCLPRFDSPSVFASLLDPAGGYWAMRPRGAFETSRRYLENSLVLETTFTCPTGRAVLTDALLVGPGTGGHDLGLHSPHTLVRSFEVVVGELTLDAAYCPRPGYGCCSPALTLTAGGVLALGTDIDLMLAGPSPQLIRPDGAFWAWTGCTGDRVVFALQSAGSGQLPPLPVRAGEDALQGQQDTTDAWRSWSAVHQRYTGPWRREVLHSGRVLQGLTFGPSGAVIAAATTSLPQQVGDALNWDCRFSWLHHVGRTVRAQETACCLHEADRLRSWLLAVTAPRGSPPNRVQAVYAIDGTRDLSEHPLDHLSGWCGSAPVRIGNDAWQQTHPNVSGELLDAVLRGADTGPDLASAERLVQLTDGIAQHWREPDQGLWEIRGDLRHYLHSKLMCWVALDRAITLADQLGAAATPERVAGWSAEREWLGAAIRELGWNEKLAAYTQSFGSTVLDASALLLLITGFLPADDPRMLATMTAITAQLSAPCGMLRRYTSSVDHPAGAATFLTCTYWMVECLALVGDQRQAITLFERATAYTNDVGLLGEEAEPLTGQLLGNFPHAASHAGLVNAASAIGAASGAHDKIVDC